MSYLLDKKNQRKKFLNISIAVFAVVVIFYFLVSFFSFFSSISHNVLRPVLVVKNGMSNVFSNLSATFYSKESLLKENESLKLKLIENNAIIFNYDSVLNENNKIKEILNRKIEKDNMILSAILSKPNLSYYDTLIIDAGLNNNVKEGDLVFAEGVIPIGRVASSYDHSSKVILFSNSGEKTEVVVGGKDTFMQIVGRGGGNFEMTLPRDFVLEKGSVATMPGIFPYVVAKVETIISDPRDSFAKALLSSPVNIQELKFVQVKK